MQSDGLLSMQQISNEPPSSDFLLDGNAPLWFKPERFLDTEFDPHAYINDLKRYVRFSMPISSKLSHSHEFLSLQVPLDTLRGELQAHLDVMHKRLIEVVNEDYDDFVTLSTKLVGVDEAIAAMKPSLLAVREQLTVSQLHVFEQAEILKGGLSKRHTIARARSTLEFMQDAAHAASKVEKLLGELEVFETPSITDDEQLETRCRLLDRVCGEISRFSFFAAKGEDFLFVKALEPRMSIATEQLQAALDVVMTAVLKRQNSHALSTCLHAYAALGRSSAAAAVVKQEIVAPIVSSSLEAIRTGDAPGRSLTDALETLQSAVNRECGAFLSLVLAPSTGGQTFEFLGTSVLSEIDSSVFSHSNSPGTPSPGIPDSFRSSYVASLHLLDSLEEYCTTSRQVSAFRASQGYKDFLKRWNLPAYFSVRMQEIGSSLEHVLGESSVNLLSAEDGQFKYKITQAVWNALRMCIAPSIFLITIADKFVRLAMQLIGRYTLCIQDWLKEFALQVKEGGPALLDINVLWEDVGAIKNLISKEYIPQFILLTQPAGAHAEEAVITGIAGGLLQLDNLQQNLLKEIACNLADESARALTQLRGIVATFRMTARNAPTRPSHYASLVLAPLNKMRIDGTFEDPIFLAVAALVVAMVCEKFAVLANDTLNAVRKTESSLKRLKARKPEGGITEEQQLSIDQLIAMQLELDVKEFGKQASKFGVVTDSLAEYQNLLNIVTYKP